MTLNLRIVLSENSNFRADAVAASVTRGRWWRLSRRVGSGAAFDLSDIPGRDFRTACRAVPRLPGTERGLRIRIVVHAIGRMKASAERDLAERYLRRLEKAGPAVGLEFAGVKESPESRARTAPARKREEAARLAEDLGDSVLILLDERGRNLTSIEISEKLAAYRDAGERQLALAIGGPDGHDEALRGRAALRLSFGAQTWPHQLVRVMLAEQLYRAVTILAGHPYHRD